jgi:hypothetical protein
MKKIFDNGTHAIFTEGEPAEPEKHYRITVQAAKLRFTPEERTTIRLLTSTNPAVFDFYDILDSGFYVDLKRNEFKQGLLYLKSIEVLTQQRVDQILNSPILETEIYRGAL